MVELGLIAYEWLEPKYQVQWVESFEPKEDESWYLISKMWYLRWRQYCIRMGSDEEGARKLGLLTSPGPIRNEALLSDGELLPNLKWAEDFYVVAEVAWFNLIKWYDFNGEPIKRKFMCRKNTLDIELYPPVVITVHYLNSPNTIDQDFKEFVMTASVSTLIKKILYRAKFHFSIDQEEEVRLLLLESSFMINSANVPLQHLLKATEINLSNPNACVSQSGNLTWLIQKKEFDKFPRGRCGLMNLGNTCYMNSAVQCLSNTPQLTKWFLSGNYKNDINKHNPLGTKGQVAEVYGDLMDRIWAGVKSTTKPLRFRNTISKLNPTFEGFQQHDTQELLAFLMDALHEDLNRVVEKPYIELPDFDGEKDSEIAQYSWDYHLSRNNSIIVDLFQGQFKSKLICKNCQGVSVTFDPFMYISLPLPAKKLISIELFYIPYDPSQRIERILLDLPKESCIIHLQQKLADVMHITAESLLVVEICNHTIYKTFNYDEPVRNILQTDTICVYRIPGLTASNLKQKFFSVFPNAEGKEEQIVLFPVYCAIVQENGNFPIPFGHPILVAISNINSSDPDQIHYSIVEHLGRYTSIKLLEDSPIESLSALEPRLEKLETNQSSQQSTTAAVTEEARKKVRPIANLFKMKLFSQEKHCWFSENSQILPTGFIDPHSTIEPTINDEATKASIHMGINSKQGSDTEVNDLLEEQPLFTCNSQEYAWVSEDRPPRRSQYFPKPLIRQGEGVWLEWTERKAEELFGISVHPKKQRASRGTWDVIGDLIDLTDKENNLTLADCLDEFTKEEELGKEDLWFCPKCKEQRHVTKKLDLWKLPKIMVVHLKRFSHSHILEDKIDDFIDFPVTELDMTDRVLSTKDPNLPIGNNRLIYDLYAVDNHYGNLKGGHYTSIAQNFDNGQWYLFDDSKVHDADISDVKTPAAYLLFYKRRLEY